MTPLLWTVARCEVGGTVAAAAVWAVTRLAGRHLPPRWRYNLWLLVLLRICLPVLPMIPVHLPRWTAQPAAVPSPSQFEPVPPETEPGRVGPVRGDTPRLFPETSPLAAVVRPSPPFDPVPLLVRTWVVVAAVLLARLIVQTVRTARLVRSYPPLADADLLAELSAAADQLGVRPPPAVVAPAGTGPAVTGLLRPRLLLPADFAVRLPPDGRRLVLLHELTHVRRRDVPLGWLASAVAAAHWFNPAAWLALSQLRVERELSADAAVLDATGDHAGYGETLVRLLQANLTPIPTKGSAMAEPVHALHQRITMIARYRPALRQRSAVVVFAALATAAASIIWVAGTTQSTARATDRPTSRPTTVPTVGNRTFPAYWADRERGLDAAHAALREMRASYAPPDGRAVWLVGAPFPPGRDKYAAAEVIADGTPLRPFPPTTWRWTSDGQLELAGYIGDTSKVDLWTRLSLGVPWYELGDLGGLAQWTPGDRDVVFRASATDREKVEAVARLISADLHQSVRAVERTLPRPWLVVRGPLTGPGLPFGPPPPVGADPQPHAIVVTARPITRADLDGWTTALKVSTGNYPPFTQPFDWQGVGYHLRAPWFDGDGGPGGQLRPVLINAGLLLDRSLVFPPSPPTPDQLRQVLANLHLQVGGDWRIEDRPTTVFDLRQESPAGARP